ncbi:MAG: tRNA (N6-isopentenyl adenosine(37)-C2)-methylthiotransferase MiaB [Pseudomonadota bacterium]
MPKKYLYINTIGCQMNIHDSERIEAMMRSSGYEITPFMELADLILFNTCSVREKAEQKTYSFLGRLAELKKKKPSLIIGTIGCVAQQEGARIRKKMPHVDLVLGTHGYHRLPELIHAIEMRRYPVSEVGWSDSVESLEQFCSQASIGENSGSSRFVTIMRGCDNYCSYCVVPYVRGKEQCRKPGKIIEEIQTLVRFGVREITLLGQNVNSYGQKEGIGSFPKLLDRVNAIDGLFRIRFTTSHPKDLSDELIESFAALDKLCHHIHLPVQSGSDRVLKKMNRKYTRDHYLDKVGKLRQACPDIAISTDIIVGFPGETENDFNQTLDLLERAHFDALFAFQYSDRPNAKASGFNNKISENEKRKRLKALFEVQREYTLKKNRGLIGKTEIVLVDGPSKKERKKSDPKKNGDSQWTGRTTTNKVVNFVSDEVGFSDRQFFSGTLICVNIQEAFANSLYGKAVGFQTK